MFVVSSPDGFHERGDGGPVVLPAEGLDGAQQRQRRRARLDAHRRRRPALEPRQPPVRTPSPLAPIIFNRIQPLRSYLVLFFFCF